MHFHATLKPEKNGFLPFGSGRVFWPLKSGLPGFGLSGLASLNRFLVVLLCAIVTFVSIPIAMNFGLLIQFWMVLKLKKWHEWVTRQSCQLVKNFLVLCMHFKRFWSLPTRRDASARIAASSHEKTDQVHQTLISNLYRKRSQFISWVALNLLWSLKNERLMWIQSSPFCN